MTKRTTKRKPLGVKSSARNVIGATRETVERNRAHYTEFQRSLAEVCLRRCDQFDNACEARDFDEAVCAAWEIGSMSMHLAVGLVDAGSMKRAQTVRAKTRAAITATFMAEAAKVHAARGGRLSPKELHDETCKLPGISKIERSTFYKHRGKFIPEG
jgi:hypothetical protein